MSAEFDQTLDALLDRSLRARLSEAGEEAIRELRGECASLLASAAENARGQARETESTRLEALAECARRIRAESTVTEIVPALAEAAARFCSRAAVFVHREGQISGFVVAGPLPEEQRKAFPRMTLALADAPAFARAVESRAAVSAMAAPEEISHALAESMGVGGADGVRIWPLVLRDRVLALLYCDGKAPEPGETPIVDAAVESLVLLAEAWIEAVGNRRRPADR